MSADVILDPELLSFAATRRSSARRRVLIRARTAVANNAVTLRSGLGALPPPAPKRAVPRSASARDPGAHLEAMNALQEDLSAAGVASVVRNDTAGLFSASVTAAQLRRLLALPTVAAVALNRSVRAVSDGDTTR